MGSSFGHTGRAGRCAWRRLCVSDSEGPLDFRRRASPKEHVPSLAQSAVASLLRAFFAFSFDNCDLVSEPMKGQ